MAVMLIRASAGSTTGRTASVWAAMGVMTSALTPGTTMGPPAESE